MEQETVQRVEKKKGAGPNLTGIPTQMKLDFERRSGLSFDDVRVHYNSDKPAQLRAMAYTQGTQVYVGPGQERHLPHELGHVVQQKRGLVRPTMRLGNVLINDDPRLEEAADLAADGGAGSFASSSASSVVQRAEGLSVGVSLRLRNDVEQHRPSDYIVDKINLSGRATTDLPNRSQGNHTIADVFVKKHQSAVVKGLALDQAVLFYRALFQEISSHNDLLPAIPEGDYEELKRSDRIEVSGIKARQSASNQLIETGIDLCDNLKDKTLNVREMRRSFKEIIVAFNNAYARCPFSTFDRGTGGHSEQSGMLKLKQFLSNGQLGETTVREINNEEELIDRLKFFITKPLVDSTPINMLQKIVGECYKSSLSVDDLIKNRFYAMIYEIGKNKYGRDAMQPKNLSDALDSSAENDILGRRKEQADRLDVWEWKTNNIKAEE